MSYSASFISAPSMVGVVRASHRTAVEKKAKENASPSPVRRLVAPLALIVVIVIALVAYLLTNARRAAWTHAEYTASRIVAALEADLSRNFETLDLSLQGVVDFMKRPDIEHLEPELRNLLLFDRSATARHLGAIYVLDTNGSFRFDSRTLAPMPINLADRDYFQAHRDNANIGLYIGAPVVTKQTKEMVIGVSRRLSNADGSFAGVAAASVRLASFQELFKGVTLGPGSNITLSRTDGTVLMRWPYRPEYVGLNISKAEIYRHVRVSRSGAFETYTAVDNVHRLVNYSQIGNLPLVVGVGQSTSQIYSSWNSFALIIALLLAVFAAAGLVLVLRLVRELKRSSEAEAHLTASNRGLQQFASIVAHDLRSPLKRIEAFIGMLREDHAGRADEREREIMSRIVFSSARMKLMLDSLLDYSRYNAISIDGKSADLTSVIKDVIEHSDFQTLQSQIRIAAVDDARVKGDPILLAHVFQNLIGNSVKFRSEEALYIDIDIRKCSGIVTISVTDNGIGIEPQFAESVFEMFCRLHNEDEYQGTGIGLSVCRKIINDHGGQIWVDTEFNLGTRIVLTLLQAPEDSTVEGHAHAGASALR